VITHIIFFKLKNRNPENIEKARERLDSLRGRVETLRSLEVGVDVLHKERSFDIALTARFDSMEGLTAYQQHPYHREVADWIKAASVSVASVDYES
jgi:hypothetical protein